MEGVGAYNDVVFSCLNCSVWRDGSFHRVPYDPPLLPESPSGTPVSTRDIPLNPTTHGTLARIYLPRDPCNYADADADIGHGNRNNSTGSRIGSPIGPPHTSFAAAAAAAAEEEEEEEEEEPEKAMRKLPILLYFHGGGFITGSTMNPADHEFYCKLALRAQVLIVSIDYRLAPEHPLPAAYQDCFEALTWLNEQAKLAGSDSAPMSPDQWLARHGDFSRCFLGGDSAGANILHHVVMKAVLGLGFREEEEEVEEGEKLGLEVGLRGLVYIHPFFTCGADADGRPAFAFEKRMWELSGARDGGRFQNPLVGGGLGLLERAELPPSLVAVAGKDPTAARGSSYHKALCDAGKPCKLLLSPGEDHVFHLYSPGSENFGPFIDELSGFLNS